MAVSMVYFWQMIREANRRHYEEEIAAGKTKRLSPELEAALFEYENDQVLTVGGQIPRDEINAKIEECAKDAGVTPREFKEMFLEHKFGKIKP